MAKVKNRVDRKLVNNEKNYFKWTSKPSHVARKISYKDLVAIHEIKTTLTLKKLAYAVANTVYLGIPCYRDTRVTVNLD